MRNWIISFLALTTTAAMAFSYVFFSRHGWYNEANPLARWLFSKIGLELSFFIVLPAYFTLFYWLIYYYYYKVGKTSVSRYFFRICYAFLCIAKAVDVIMWVWVFFIIKAY